MSVDMTTTITAIVTKEDDGYCVYFASALKIGVNSSVGGGSWYATDKSPLSMEDQDAAIAYAERLVLYENLDHNDMEMMDAWHRVSCGSYQGCWNAPIVYRASHKHQGDLWPI